MLELILELLGEFLLQFIAEALLELGLHAVAAPFRRSMPPWLAAGGYALWGGIVGGLSVLVVPLHLVATPWRIVNLVVTPLAMGGMMALIGVLRARRGQAVLRIDRFAYGFLFALALAGVRFVLAR